MVHGVFQKHDTRAISVNVFLTWPVMTHYLRKTLLLDGIPARDYIIFTAMNYRCKYFYRYLLIIYG